MFRSRTRYRTTTSRLGLCPYVADGVSLERPELLAVSSNNSPVPFGSFLTESIRLLDPDHHRVQKSA